MRKNLLYALPVTLAIGAFAFAAQAQTTLFPMFPNAERVNLIQPTGGDFNGTLAREYKSLSLFEAHEMEDWRDAEYFGTKAMRADAGDTPLPTDLATRQIRDSGRLAELQSGRAELIGLLDGGGRAGAPLQAGVAQARFDCWAEQEEEGHQFDHIASCRTAFLSAMQALRDAMQPSQVTTAMVEREVARQVVYFDWDVDSIGSAERDRLNTFLDEMRAIGPVTLYIEGHADTSGAADYNQDLSRRRAENVRAELVGQGMMVGDYRQLDLVPKGQTDLAVPTPDGTREARNRRVEIVATGQTTRETTVEQTSSVVRQ
jgi:OOP family OmpA-OmpF porin